MQDKQCHTTMQLWSGQNSEKKVLKPSMNYIYICFKIYISFLTFVRLYYFALDIWQANVALQHILVVRERRGKLDAGN